MPVFSILDLKGSTVWCVRPDAQVGEAAKLLDDQNIGAAVVSRDNKEILGILSERDILRGLVEHGGALLQRQAQDIMTRDVVTCSPRDNVAGLLAVMTERRVRHIPVVENGELCGIISIGDAVKKRVSEAQGEADAMREYITRY